MRNKLYAVVAVLVLTGCPVVVPSPGGVQGRWSDGKNVTTEGNRTDSYELIYGFSGPTATLELVQTATAAGQSAQIVTAVTSTFELVETDSGPALSFTQPLPSRNPSEADLRSLASVYIAGLTAEEREAAESGLLEGQTLETAYVGLLQFMTALSTSTMAMSIDCFGASCSPVLFALEGDSLVLSLSSGDVTLSRV